MNNVQVLLFQHIKALLPPQLSVVEEIAGVLEISTDSAYRRIRGEKPISFEDLQKLCTRYLIIHAYPRSPAYLFSSK